MNSKQPNEYCKTASEQSAHSPTFREAGQEYSQREGWETVLTPAGQYESRIDALTQVFTTV